MHIWAGKANINYSERAAVLPVDHSSDWMAQLAVNHSARHYGANHNYTCFLVYVQALLSVQFHLLTPFPHPSFLHLDIHVAFRREDLTGNNWVLSAGRKLQTIKDNCMLMFNKPCKSLQISVVAKQPCQGKARLIPRLWLGKINTKLLWPATFPCGGKKQLHNGPPEHG